MVVRYGIREVFYGPIIRSQSFSVCVTGLQSDLLGAAGWLEGDRVLSLQCRHNCRCLAWITVSHDWAICKVLCVYWLLYWIIYWIIIRLSIVHLMLIYHLLYMKWQTTVAELMRDKGSWGAPTFPVHCTVVDIYVTLRIPLVGHARTKLSFFLIFICLFIYLAVLGIDWGTEDLHCSTQASLVAPCRLL